MAPPPAAGREKERPEDPDTHIKTPGPNDVLLGRGGGTNNHEGNVTFRKLVAEHKIRYLDASKVDKPKVAREVVKLWRAMDPPGRFLARVSGTGPVTTRNEDALWYDVGDKKAREKASQCLRERTADVIPYVKSLNRKKAEEFNKTVAAAASASNASLLSAMSASASQHSFGVGVGGGATLSSNSLMSGVGMPPPNVGPDELDDFLEMQQRQIDAQQAFLAEQQRKLAAGGGGAGAHSVTANPAMAAAHAMMAQGGVAGADAAASMHSLFSLGSLGSISGSLRSLGGAGGVGGTTGTGGAGGGADAAISLKSVMSTAGTGTGTSTNANVNSNTTTTNNNNNEAANSLRSIGSLSMGMAAGIGSSMKSIGSIPVSTGVPGSMRSINTGISSIGSGPDGISGGLRGGGGGSQTNLMAGAMPQLPQLPPNATPQQKQAMMMQMQMAQQQQAMLMQQQMAILQQRQQLQQAAAANAQAQAQVLAQMEVVQQQRRRSSEVPHMSPLPESATSSSGGSARATPAAETAVNPPLSAGQPGNASLVDITPEMAAQFGIDPAMLAKLQAAAAAQAMANATANGSDAWEPTPVGPRPASAGPYGSDLANNLMAKGDATPAQANGGSANNDDEEGELTLEEYTRSLEEYIQKEVGHIVIKDETEDDNLTKVSGSMSAGTGASSLNPLNDLRAQLADHKSNSWVKSFHSLEDDMMDASFMSGSGSFHFEGSLAGLSKTSEPSKETSGSKPTPPQDRQKQQQQQQQQQQKRRAMSSTRSQASTDERSRSKYGKAQRSGPSAGSVGGGEHPSMPPPAIHAGRGRGADGGPRRRRKQKVEIIQPATIGEDMPASGGVDAEGMSLFSGDSLFSTGLSMGDGTRVSKDSKTKHLRSDISMMSELTDLSDAACKMSIGR